MLPASRCRAALFDLDGTLTNTLADIADAMNFALRSAGLPEWPEEKYRFLVGNGARVLTQRAVRDRSDLTDLVQRVYQRQYETHSMVRTRPYPGVPELLRSLAERGCPVCVFTNKPDADARKIVAHYFPEIPFARVLGQTDRLPLKPDPAAALLIARELNLPPEAFAYLGDSGVDMQCARRAGMRAFGALWGFRPREELQENGAEVLLSAPEELLAYMVP